MMHYRELLSVHLLTRPFESESDTGVTNKTVIGKQKTLNDYKLHYFK